MQGEWMAPGKCGCSFLLIILLYFRRDIIIRQRCAANNAEPTNKTAPQSPPSPPTRISYTDPPPMPHLHRDHPAARSPPRKAAPSGKEGSRSFCGKTTSCEEKSWSSKCSSFIISTMGSSKASYRNWNPWGKRSKSSSKPSLTYRPKTIFWDGLTRSWNWSYKNR